MSSTPPAMPMPMRVQGRDGVARTGSEGGEAPASSSAVTCISYSSPFCRPLSVSLALLSGVYVDLGESARV